MFIKVFVDQGKDIPMAQRDYLLNTDVIKYFVEYGVSVIAYLTDGSYISLSNDEYKKICRQLGVR